MSIYISPFTSTKYSVSNINAYVEGIESEILEVHRSHEGINQRVYQKYIQASDIEKLIITASGFNCEKTDSSGNHVGEGDFSKVSYAIDISNRKIQINCNSTNSFAWINLHSYLKTHDDIFSIYYKTLFKFDKLNKFTVNLKNYQDGSPRSKLGNFIFDYAQDFSSKYANSEWPISRTENANLLDFEYAGMLGSGCTTASSSYAYMQFNSCTCDGISIPIELTEYEQFPK